MLILDRKLQVAGRPWRSIIGGQGERTILLLPGSLVPDLFFVIIQALVATWPGQILILESECDEASRPANRARTRAIYPQARVHTISHATHFAIVAHTQEYLRTMREFLAAS